MLLLNGCCQGRLSLLVTTIMRMVHVAAVCIWMHMDALGVQEERGCAKHQPAAAAAAAAATAKKLQQHHQRSTSWLDEIRNVALRDEALVDAAERREQEESRRLSAFRASVAAQRQQQQQQVR